MILKETKKLKRLYSNLDKPFSLKKSFVNYATFKIKYDFFNLPNTKSNQISFFFKRRKY